MPTVYVSLRLLFALVVRAESRSSSTSVPGMSIDDSEDILLLNSDRSAWRDGQYVMVWLSKASRLSPS